LANDLLKEISSVIHKPIKRATAMPAASPVILMMEYDEVFVRLLSMISRFLLNMDIRHSIPYHKTTK
jgi:hypothetical protein